MRTKDIKELVAPYEIPVPEGHRRRHKGSLHLFFRPGALGKVVKGLVAGIGRDPEFRSEGYVTPLLAWPDGTVVWFPSPLEGEWATVSVPTADH